MDADPTTVAAQALHRTLTQEGVFAELRGVRVLVGRAVIELNAVVEQEGAQDGRYLLGLFVQMAINGRILPPLRMGTVAGGKTRAEALAEAAIDWSAYVGMALARFLRPELDEPGKPYRLAAGAQGVRGGVDGVLLEQRRAPLADVVERFAAELTDSSTSLHSLVVMVYVGPDGQLENQECRCDGELSPRLAEAVQTLPWPPGNPRYIFKRFYLIQKRR